jgi:hypothetical protein
MFDDLFKEEFTIPIVSKMRFLTELQRPQNFPQEPTMNVDVAHGLLKVASIIKTAQSDEQAALNLEQQAMIDPQVQQALDFHQVSAERDGALAQVRQMNQQLFDAQAAQAVADQAAQQTGQQVAELEGQLQQEQMAKQEAQAQMLGAKDQSLQEQMAVQDQKLQMNEAAQRFQNQANMLAQQIKDITAQPSVSPPLDAAGAPGVEELPPPASADAAQEQQEAANAAQEADIQGQQAAAATEGDMAKQEQMSPPQMNMPPPPTGEEFPKQANAQGRIVKRIMAPFVGGGPSIAKKAELFKLAAAKIREE